MDAVQKHEANIYLHELIFQVSFLARRLTSMRYTFAVVINIFGFWDAIKSRLLEAISISAQVSIIQLLAF